MELEERTLEALLVHFKTHHTLQPDQTGKISYEALIEALGGMAQFYPQTKFNDFKVVIDSAVFKEVCVRVSEWLVESPLEHIPYENGQPENENALLPYRLALGLLDVALNEVDDSPKSKLMVSSALVRFLKFSQMTETERMKFRSILNVFVFEQAIFPGFKNILQYCLMNPDRPALLDECILYVAGQHPQALSAKFYRETWSSFCYQRIKEIGILNAQRRGILHALVSPLMALEEISAYREPPQTYLAKRLRRDITERINRNQLLEYRESIQALAENPALVIRNFVDICLSTLYEDKVFFDLARTTASSTQSGFHNGFPLYYFTFSDTRFNFVRTWDLLAYLAPRISTQTREEIIAATLAFANKVKLDKNVKYTTNTITAGNLIDTQAEFSPWAKLAMLLYFTPTHSLSKNDLDTFLCVNKSRVIKGATTDYKKNLRKGLIEEVIPYLAQHLDPNLRRLGAEIINRVGKPLTEGNQANTKCALRYIFQDTRGNKNTDAASWTATKLKACAQEHYPDLYGKPPTVKLFSKMGQPKKVDVAYKISNKDNAFDTEYQRAYPSRT